MGGQFQTLYEEFGNIINKEWKDFIPDEEVQSFSNSLQDYLHNNNSLKLYRYSRCDFFNLRNIEKNQLRLSPIGDMNDLYEGLPVDDYKNLSYDDLKQLNDVAYIKSFSTVFDSILMWSHYADYHRGICVEYDLTELEATDPILDHIFPVHYSTKRYCKSSVKSIRDELRYLRIDINERNEHDEEGWLNDIMALFLIKGKSWEYEQEWRILYTLYQIYKEDKPNLYNFTIPFDCITGIYLGYRIDPAVEEYISDMVQRINSANRLSHRSTVHIYKAELQPASYALTFNIV